MARRPIETSARGAGVREGRAGWYGGAAGRHPNESVKPDDAALFDLVARWAPDPKTRHRILVVNPDTGPKTFKELLALSNANNQWSTAQTSADQHIWLLRTDNGDSVGACDTLQRKTHCLLKVVPGFTEVVALYQV